MAGGSFFSAGAGRSGIYAVAENVRSLFNVGAIFRSADGVNASGVVLTGFTGAPPRKEISRVALGADASVPWVYYPEPVVAIQDLKAHGVAVVALEDAEDAVDYRSYPYTFPVAFVLGHEVEGVSDEVLACCDATVRIPMLGEKVSLNVSVAAGVMMYQLLTARERGRGFDG